MGHLLRPPYHDLRGDQTILQMGIGAFYGGTYLEPLLLGWREHALLLAPLVRIDDGDAAAGSTWTSIASRAAAPAAVGGPGR